MRQRLWFDAGDRLASLRRLDKEKPLPPPRVIYARPDMRVRITRDARGSLVWRRFARSA